MQRAQPDTVGHGDVLLNRLHTPQSCDSQQHFLSSGGQNRVPKFWSPEGPLV